MEITESFIRAHQFPFPELGDEVVETPFTIEFSPELTDVTLFLDDVFDGGDPFYMPGICRPTTPDHDQYTVGTTACSIPEDDETEKTYDVHHPPNHNIWFDVTTDELNVYVRDTVAPERVKVFCETLGEQYGVELQRVEGLPAVPEQVAPEEVDT